MAATSSVTVAQTREFYSCQVPKERGGGNVVCDIRSFSIWSKIINEGELGYDRDHVRMAQLS